MHAKKGVKSLKDLAGKKVLVRVDFNVPLDEHQKITDDSRIQETLPTLRYLLDQKAVVILMSHLGRPKGQVVEDMRMRPVAEKLQSLIKTTVHYFPEWDFEKLQRDIAQLPPGSLVLLENLRFLPEEEKKDPAFSKKLASLGEIYVNDAFGTAHRAHASTYGVAENLPVKVAGLLMEKEIQCLGSLFSQPKRPFVAIIGGSKVSTKITVLDNLLKAVDTLVIGGGMLFTFLKAKGLDVGNSLVEPEYLETAKKLMEQAKTEGKTLLLAEDVVVAEAFKNEAPHKTVAIDAIPATWMGLDIGPKSIQAVEQVIQSAKTVLWNGPLGVFEMENFAQGTRAVANALAKATQKGCQTVLGGGDTVAAIEQFGFNNTQFTHVSTGGGASLELLEGKELPGIAILEDAHQPATV